MPKLTRSFALEEHYIGPYTPTFVDRDITVFMKDMEVEVLKEIEPDTDGQRLFVIYSPALKEATVVGAYALEGYDK